METLYCLLPAAKCAHEQCQEPVHCRGFCAKHYQKARREGLGNLQKPTHCLQPSCNGRVSCRGLCRKHYDQAKHERQWSGPVCSVDGCSKGVAAKGFCPSHYDQWRHNGDPLIRINPVKGSKGGRYIRSDSGAVYCMVDGKLKREHRLVMERHLGRSLGRDEYVWHRNGDRSDNRLENLEIRTVAGWVNEDGYRIVSVKGQSILEHRHVMEQQLGRQLHKDESVHHINGIRDDNRPENLELWSSRHPKGQRVVDKVKWAREIISLYGHLHE